mmetsp:Transcript_119962/g.373622  ORF Transcript_119962/g.373622 Transcript_119962/m.373622 type:complete len:219 (+) Transcript_119962:63-719(+)
MTRSAARALMAAAVAAVASAADCNVNLLTKGFPECQQACEEWCWATIVGEFEEYYRVSPLLRERPGVTPQCRHDECSVASEAFGTDCCTGEPGGCMTGKKPCGLPMMASNISTFLQRRVPSAGRWQLHEGIPEESTVASLLKAGHPIGRLVPGHIDAIVACRPGKSGQTEYRLADSLVPDGLGLWFPNYTFMMEVPFAPGQAVYGLIYAKPEAADIVV